jgi:hypothetical protein
MTVTSSRSASYDYDWQNSAENSMMDRTEQILHLSFVFGVVDDLVLSELGARYIELSE